MIQDWVELAAAVAFIGVIAWKFWDDIGRWYDRPAQVCTGCQRYFIKAGCPVHDKRAA